MRDHQFSAKALEQLAALMTTKAEMAEQGDSGLGPGLREAATELRLQAEIAATKGLTVEDLERTLARRGAQLAWVRADRPLPRIRQRRGVPEEDPDWNEKP